MSKCGWKCINISECPYVSSKMFEKTVLIMLGLWMLISLIILHVPQVFEDTLAFKMPELHIVLDMLSSWLNIPK